MQRHDLVTLHPGSPFRFACAAEDPVLQAAVGDWIGRGRPLVAARQAPDRNEILLGLTLPLSHKRQRVGCIVDADAVASVQAPLRLGQCLHRLPAATAVPLAILEREIGRCGAALGVFGSLAWEVISGEDYRQPTSDVDVICDIATRYQFDASLAALHQAACVLDQRLDGELRFPDGNAVAWREIHDHRHDPAALVLAKGAVDVGLLPLGRLLATLIEERRRA